MSETSTTTSSPGDGVDERPWECAARVTVCGTPSGYRLGGRCARCRAAHTMDCKRLHLRPDQRVRILALVRAGESLTVAALAAGASHRAALNTLLVDVELAAAHLAQMRGDTSEPPSHLAAAGGAEGLISTFGEAKTLREWADDPRCVVNVSTLAYRVGNGWNLERALTTPARSRTPRQAFGESKLLSEWAQDPRCVVGFNTLNSRVYQGWDLEDALVTPLSSAKPKRAEAKRGRRWPAFGETKTLMEWARDPRCVVDATTLRWRLRDNWAPERAITQPPSHPRRPRLHTAFGETKTLTEWAQDPRCQTTHNALSLRIAKGWPVEEAITRPRRVTVRRRAANRRKDTP